MTMGERNKSGLRVKSWLVMLVEDDSTIRALYGAALREEGFYVDEVVSVDEAIEVATRLRPDAIILDRHLTDGDGWDVAKQLKAADATRAIPIIAFTAHHQRDDVESALVAGCDSFVAKPCQPLTLVRHVKGVLGIPQPDLKLVNRSS
ncbi:MAG TPA: response regulator [Labilithrix sp.]|jgi:DNA-binding response OmpR family regulator